MADTVAVMNAGRIEQMGAPEELYDLPRTAFVANFLGQSNLGAATITGQDGEHLVADVSGTTVRVPTSRATVDGTDLLFGIRPEKVRVHEQRPEGAGSDVRGTVTDVSFTGVATQYLVEVASGGTWVVYEQNLDVERNTIRAGDEVWLGWDPGHAFAVPPAPVPGASADSTRAAAGAEESTAATVSP